MKATNEGAEKPTFYSSSSTRPMLQTLWLKYTQKDDDNIHPYQEVAGQSILYFLRNHFILWNKATTIQHQYRAEGSSENPGGRVVIWWAYLNHMVDIRFTDLSKYGGQSPPRPTCFLQPCTTLEHLSCVTGVVCSVRPRTVYNPQYGPIRMYKSEK